MTSDVFGGTTQNHIISGLTNGHRYTHEKKLPNFSVEEVGFFEGPEKLLEVWFDLYPLEEDETSCAETALNSHCDYDKGLRIIPRSNWEVLLKLVNCEILSSCSNGYMDAYLLSESSLFVSSNRFVLKTCGNTTLLCAVKPLFQLISAAFPNNKVTAFFYSHRNFQKPQLQPHPHSSFEDEVRYLDRIFKDGAAYALGRINGDAWYLYTVCVPQLVEGNDQTLEGTKHSWLSNILFSWLLLALQILMTDLDPDIMALYSSVAYPSGKLLMRDTGIDQIVPGAILDSKIFDPCGFSANAIIKGDEYFTIHVTPQVECSWVSFETNLVLDSHIPIIAKVLSIFKPGSFTMSLFMSKNSNANESLVALGNEKIRGYRCRDKQSCSFNSYDLTFGHFTRASKDNPYSVCR
ncbi:S-adenosylmethionine decarboxylase proenzyme-like isoform X2 [Halichondria panicea]|uniref:S-adenosylmethionine decarboxylase proenzyme-like isoform X2 n=1 Tax=Halichondria panicea TaxID=6063 RepID=UPI00312BB326